jgi:hypothetical protein
VTRTNRGAEGIGGRVKFLPLAWAGMPKTSFRKNSDSPLRLIIADYYAEKNWNGSNDSSPYWKKFKDLAIQGEDIWFVNTSFEDFAQLIPDLRSLNKAERLAKDIQSLIGGH